LVRTDQLMILTAGLALYHDVERRRLADSMRPGVLDHGFELLGRGSFGGSDPFEGRKHPVETSGAAERSPRWPTPADPDRRPGLLDRRGQEQALGNAVMTALVGKRLATPQAADDVESLIDQFRGVGPGLDPRRRRRTPPGPVSQAQPQR
jgi:hypothetical protein